MSCHARLASAVVIACALAVGATTPPPARAAVAAPGGLDVGRFHACALVAATSVRCWGYGGDGALGYGNVATIGDDETPDAAGPVDFGAGRSARMVATGALHSCALLDDGSVRCWGFGVNGRLGYGNEFSIGDDESPAGAGPVNLGAGRTAVSIAAGRAHTCAILDTGDVRCWGFGFDGRLGYGDTASIGDTETPAAAGPVKLGLGRTATALALGDSHTCALLDDGTVRCWGFAGFGALGYGSTATFSSTQTPDTAGPVQLGGTAVAITAGNFHTCALLADGTVRCWGFGGDGELGYGNRFNVGDDEVPAIVGPVDLGPGRTAVAIDAGGDFTCALLDNGTVRCWGDGSNGRLGDGSTANIGDDETPGSIAPVDLGAGVTAVAIAAGWTSACARLSDGGIRCWGAGLAGLLGDCRVDDVGDDESPATIGPIALGEPGVAGMGCPPPALGLTAPPQPAAAPSRPAPDDGVAAQRARAAALRACRTGVSRRAATQRRRARVLPVAARAAAIRRIDVRARRGLRACVTRYARTPGLVTALTAKAIGRHTIVLGFRATGTDGIKPPAARGYVVKQSPRPIRTARDVRRAHALCHGTCRFAVDEVGRRISLKVTGLTTRRTFYYVVMARDNVTARTGPRSHMVRARTR